MILTAKIKNQAATWSANKKYRVTDVAFDGVNYFTNTSGINSALTDTANWFKLTDGGGSGTAEIDKAAGDISASGSDFVIDLSADGMPAFPVAITVYVDINGDGHPLPVSPVNFDPVSRILSGLDSPTDFPSQLVKIMAV